VRRRLNHGQSVPDEIRGKSKRDVRNVSDDGSQSGNFNVEIGGFATAYSQSISYDPYNDEIINISATFSTIPEPSSFVEAAIGILIISIFVGVRRLSAR
jgi:hypothetical protein